MHNFLGINNILVTWYTLHMWISKKGNYISSDAHFSWHQEYHSHMIYHSFLIERDAKYWKKCGASPFMSFLFLKKKTISYDAQFSWHWEHTSHMTYPSYMDSTWTVWIDSSRNSPGIAGLWHISLTSVTPITKKGNYISSDAHFSWHQEYPGHMIYPSFLIEKNEKYWKKCGTSQFMLFLFLEKKLSHLMHNFLGIENILVTWSTLVM